MNPISYVTGHGLALVRPGVVVLVERADASLSEALWQLTDRTPDVLALIDALAVRGFTELPDFAAVLCYDDRAHVLVRGAHAVEFLGAAGERVASFDGAGVSTWSEHNESLANVTAIAIRDASHPDELLELPIVSGIVRASRILLGARSHPDAGASGSAGTAQDSGREDHGSLRAPVPATAHIVSIRTVPDDSAALGVPDVPDAPDGPGTPEVLAVPDLPDPRAGGADLREVGDQVNAPVPGPPAPLAPGGPDVSTPTRDSGVTLIEADDTRYDAQWGMTIVGQGPENAAVRDLSETQEVQSPVVTPPETGDHDHHTMTPDEFARIKAARKSAQVQPGPTAGSPTVGPAARLLLSNGKEILIDGPVVIGRSPRVRHASGGALPVPVIIEDPEQMVSGTHLEISIAGGVITATDVSRNGTEVSQAGEPAHALPKDAPVVVADGSVFHLSDHISVEVTLL